VRRLTDAGHVAADDIVAVSVTSQWSGTVAVDAEGRHLHPAVIWMDSRGAPYVEELVTGRLNIAGYDAVKLRSWIQKTGGIPSHSGKDPIGHILWLRNERPEVYRDAHAFLEPCDYLNARLTGRQCASFDSIVTHWLTDNRDLTAVRYDPQLLAWCGFDQRQFPELVPSASVVGTVLPAVAEAWGLTPDTQVVTATGDVHSAVVGSGALADYEGHLYMGTSSWLSCHVPSKRTDLLHNQAALPSAVPGRYFLANEHEVGGGALLWLRDQVEMVRDLDEANDLAARAPAGSGRVIFTPWLNGERTPSTTTPSAAVGATCRSPPPAPTSCARCSRAWPTTAAGCSTPWSGSRSAPRRAQLHRRRGPLRPVVPDARRCLRPHDPPGGRAPARQHPRRRVRGVARPGAHHPRRAQPVGGDRSGVPPRPGRAGRLRAAVQGVRALYKAHKPIHARLNAHP
jgi:sugar (pentulose or hexulose) kinase